MTELVLQLYSQFTRLSVFPFVVCLALLGASSFADSHPSSVGRYAEITPHGSEEIVDLLNRVAEYQQSGELFDDPIVIMLHGPEAVVFTRKKYSMYKPVVDLAEKLDMEGVIDLQICEAWMAVNRITPNEIPSFIKPVPYGQAVIEALEEVGYIRF